MSLGPLEIALILVVVLIIFGPKNLPKLGSAMGKTVKSIRQGMSDGDKPELEEYVEEEYEDIDIDDEDDEEEPPVRRRRSTKKTTRTSEDGTVKKRSTTKRTTRSTRTTKAN